MSVKRHPSPETLIAYAAGTLPNAIACAVACHLTMCPECAGHVRQLELLGGLLLDNIEFSLADREFGQEKADGPPQDVLPSPAPPSPAPSVASGDWLPPPLAIHLGMSGSEIPWKPVVKGVRQYWIKLPPGSGHMRLLRLAPGKVLLEHSHLGMELTLVLKGIYADHRGQYLPGDVSEWSEGTKHRPFVEGEGECICLVAGEALPRYSWWLARLLRPIMGF
jgi:putative transcriptional regulator